MSTEKRPPASDSPEARVRRGCIGVAILLTAMSWLLVLSSGNLAWGLLMIVVVLLLVARRYIV